MATLSPVRSSEVEIIAERRRFGPDILTFVVMLLLIGVGVLMIYASTRERLELENIDPTYLMTRQIIFGVVAVAVYVVGSLIDYREYRNFGAIIYLLTLVPLLIAISPLNPSVKSVDRWIPVGGGVEVQPSEFAKIAMILVLATVLAPARREGMRWRRIAQSLFLMGVPAVLIFLQPDLGTMLVFAFVLMVMLFAAGADWKQLGALLIAGVISIWSVFALDVLEPYQYERLTSFLDENVDPLDAGFQQIQSVRAIGSGQMTGKGIFEGALTNLQFVPEQETDFIFTAVGEQLGFLGSALVLLAFVLMLWRIFVTAATARDRYGSLVAVGVGAMIVFHVFVNIGMTIKIMPVTGLPLPFLSYGGSALLSMAFALGVVNSVRRRRSPVPGETYIV